LPRPVDVWLSRRRFWRSSNQKLAGQNRSIKREELSWEWVVQLRIFRRFRALCPWGSARS
jgi:hypothetical protein